MTAEEQAPATGDDFARVQDVLQLLAFEEKIVIAYRTADSWDWGAGTDAVLEMVARRPSAVVP